MADPRQRLDTNVQGNFFVDTTCINCDTCRQLAPDSFQEVGEYSAVTIQPESDERLHQAYQALLACPVGSIGTERSDKTRLQQAMSSFPILLDGGVFYCGFNSEKSFGANSYFIHHSEGNWLVDSPRYIKHLVDAIERMGGLRYIFLTHEDDVADAARYAARFGATRIIHRADAEAMPDAEWIVDGSDVIPLTPQFDLIPVPGHTPGSSALLYDQRFLFTGDHLWWEPETRSLQAPRRLVWRSRAMVLSLERLLDYRFEWVLPGHGDRIKLTPEDMRNHLRLLVDHRLAALAS
ncbi:MAG TPA: MBL fold metallo-hydrolase [Nitrospira sp.]|nr:MBL fold metallo-hydrolase [Nitrospira sp.]